MFILLKSGSKHSFGSNQVIGDSENGDDLYFNELTCGEEKLVFWIIYTLKCLCCSNQHVISEVTNAVDNRNVLADLLQTASQLVNWKKFTSNSHEEWVRTSSDFDFFGYSNKQKEQYDIDQAQVLMKILKLTDLNVLEEDETEYFSENFTDEIDESSRLSALSNKLKNRNGIDGSASGGLTVPTKWKGK